MKRLLGSERLLILILAAVILGLSFYPLVYYRSISPAGTIFPLIHNYAPDYNLYLHYMRQGWDGHFLINTNYTPETYPDRFVYPIYIVLGHAAGLFSISLPVTYNLSRLVFGIVFLYLITRLIQTVYPTSPWKRKGAYFFCILGTGFVGFDGIHLVRYLPFWTEINILERFAYIPHHLFAKMLSIGVILLLAEAIKQPSVKNDKHNSFSNLNSKLRLPIRLRSPFSRPWVNKLLIAAFLGILTGLSSPYVLINLEITLVFTAFLYAVSFRNNRKILIRTVGMLVFFMAVSSLSLIYQRWVEQASFPWTSYIDWEKQVFPLDIPSFLLSLGPLFWFSLLAVPEFFRKKSFLSLLLVAWLFEPIIGIVFISKLGILTNVRFLSGSHFIPIGIIGAWGVICVSKFIASKSHIKPKIIGCTIVLLCSIIFFLNIKINLSDNLHTFSPGFYNYFIPTQLWQGFDYLNNYTPPGAIVLSNGYTGNLIPAYTHSKAVLGHLTHTYNLSVKEQEALRFFRQEDVEFAHTLLNKYHVRYVFYSLDTDPPNANFITKMGLVKVFGKDRSVIYKVE